eukprot:gnl/MRDRNA2_/MRDRNA2_41982_c0_seq1.p1 gnl/MRDRNA2_/MRDRNA2_41982_c0~~gnl/MRDRNA2_/MRDRNA2_41982_c0_seq1.p1  ORF type:complete len:433 (+),score=67.92 gnl/MRDRNA2_/MRDRNA2_41982_c0_seq1:49-1347(+)
MQCWLAWAAFAVIATGSVSNKDEVDIEPRDCELYHAYAYPSGYGIELNVTCSPVTSGSAKDKPHLGLSAARAFSQGEVIAWVPEAYYIWEPTIRFPIRHAVAEACDPPSYPEAVLAVALLVERREPDSRFKHYIASLARVTLAQIQNIAGFTMDHLSVLNVTRPDLVETFLGALRCVESVGSNIKSLQTTPATQGERLWAMGIVRSRAIKLRGRLALVPVVDLANHGRPPTVELGTQEPNGGAFLQSLAPLEKDMELVLDYGSKMTNIELLATHGFTIANNPSGMILPFDFNTIYEVEDGQEDLPDCTESLRWPHIWRDEPMLLDAIPAGCFEDRLFRYFSVHYTEIRSLNQNSIQIKALELIGKLCQQVLTAYEGLGAVLNRLQQHGQKVRDRVSLLLADAAVEDMRFLRTCVQASNKREKAIAAATRDDL